MHLSAKETLELMLNHLGLTAEVQEEQRSEGVALNILMENPGWLVSEDNHALDELQYLLNRVMLSEESDQPKIIVDVNHHRKVQQQEFLKSVIEDVETVRQSGDEMTLPPMNSFERMLVHNHFKEDPEIETTSPQGPDRIKQITVRRIGN
jgi:spoIIIJ-associated protein